MKKQSNAIQHIEPIQNHSLLIKWTAPAKERKEVPNLILMLLNESLQTHMNAAVTTFGISANIHSISILLWSSQKTDFLKSCGNHTNGLMEVLLKVSQPDGCKFHIYSKKSRTFWVTATLISTPLLEVALGTSQFSHL